MINPMLTMYGAAMRWLWTMMGVALAGCATNEPEVPGLHFEQDPGSIVEAWTAARTDPSGQIGTTFPVVTFGMPEGAELRLLAGRSGNDPDYPATTGDDVIIANERLLATT